MLEGFFLSCRAFNLSFSFFPYMPVTNPTWTIMATASKPPTDKKGDAKPEKTDMSAVITDNKSGVPDRPAKVSNELRAEENAYQQDILGKNVGGGVAKAPEDTEKNAELSKLLHKEEERLKRIEKDLKSPDKLVKDLMGENTLRTIGNESEFASTTNIKTDLDMKMTDQSLQSPGRANAPKIPQAAGAAPRPTGKAQAAAKPSYTNLDDNIKTNVEAQITDHRSSIQK